MNSRLLCWYIDDATVFGHVLTACKFVVQADDVQWNDLSELWSTYDNFKTTEIVLIQIVLNFKF